MASRRRRIAERCCSPASSGQCCSRCGCDRRLRTETELIELAVGTSPPIVREASNSPRDADGSEDETGRASPIVLGSAAFFDGPFTPVITNDTANAAALYAYLRRRERFGLGRHHYGSKENCANRRGRSRVSFRTFGSSAAMRVPRVGVPEPRWCSTRSRSRRFRGSDQCDQHAIGHRFPVSGNRGQATRVSVALKREPSALKRCRKRDGGTRGGRRFGPGFLIQAAASRMNIPDLPLPTFLVRERPQRHRHPTVVRVIQTSRRAMPDCDPGHWKN